MTTRGLGSRVLNLKGIKECRFGAPRRAWTMAHEKWGIGDGMRLAT